MTSTRTQPASQSRTTHPTVAIVGATGAVGQEFLRVLDQRSFPLGGLKLLASARSAGKSVEFQGEPIVIDELTEKSFEGVDIALFSAGGSISKQYAQVAVDAGAVVVDNSSAFRMTDGVPLIVPEVNAEAIAEANIGLGEGQQAGIIANPNCSTIILLLAVTPIHRAVGVNRLVVSTYQAASGAGAAAMAELEQQTREVLAGDEPTCDIFPQQYAFNLFSHNSPLKDNGYNEEELKMVHETHKIWGQPPAGSSGKRTAITATCIRVPVMRAHAESINLTLDMPLTEDDARQLLAAAPGVSLIDDRENNRFPTPLDASHIDDVFVGRIRRDLSQPQGQGLDLFVCGDQVRKGAALNAVQIAELLLG
ncbi:MAG: aspartate-semialdehyde dehydrogenase [Planctomycetota bacterium]